jgi:hypothetical protein
MPSQDRWTYEQKNRRARITVRARFSGGIYMAKAKVNVFPQEAQGRHSGVTHPKVEKVVNAKHDPKAQATALSQRQESQQHEWPEGTQVPFGFERNRNREEETQTQFVARYSPRQKEEDAQQYVLQTQTETKTAIHLIRRIHEQYFWIFSCIRAFANTHSRCQRQRLVGCHWPKVYQHQGTVRSRLEDRLAFSWNPVRCFE